MALALAVGCGSDNALVGGRCRDGLLLQDGTCRTPVTGPEVTANGTEPPPDVDGSDLASGVVRPPRFDRDAGTETPSPWPDAGEAPDAGVTPDADAPDANAPDANAPDAQTPDADTPDADVEPVCAPPLVACGGGCISVDADPLNCGACGKICPSNICIAGECQGETPGDVVLVGHDFAQAWSGSAQARVLVNAVAIPTTNPIRVLTWEDGADATAVDHVKYLVTNGIRGRRVRFTRVTAADLTDPTLAAQADVVLLFDAAGAQPTTLGSSWASGLGQFTGKGGVVVALDGASTDMPSLVTATGLLSVPAHALLPSATHLFVAAPNDVVGAQVLSPYAAAGAAVSFSHVTPEGFGVTWVVREDADGGAGDPVVVHRTVR